MNIILASASPRRRELLQLAGYDFDIEVSDVEETLIPGSPGELVEHLSLIKARDVAGKHTLDGGPGIWEEEAHIRDETGNREGDLLVIGADTVVAMDEAILGKPEDAEDAFRMLTDLSGRSHQVYTGVTLFFIREGKIRDQVTFSECTEVIMRQLSPEEIRAYIASGEPMDKAGAYGIQGKAAVFISGIQGDYYNVVGLPICRLTEQIRDMETRWEGQNQH